MKAKDFHFRSVKESPSEAEIPSHKLLIRAGMIKNWLGYLCTAAPRPLSFTKNRKNYSRGNVIRRSTRNVNPNGTTRGVLENLEGMKSWERVNANRG